MAGPFRSAEEYRYSIDRLCGEYGANVEQVAHRLTTLNRTGARGVPLLHAPGRPGRAISSAARARISPSRASAPARWNLHAAFQAAGQVVTQLIETPDGQRYFTVARTIERPIKPDLSGGLLAIGLGCDIRLCHESVVPRFMTLQMRPSRRSARPVRSARAWTAPIAPRRRRPMLAVDRTRKTISPSRSWRHSRSRSHREIGSILYCAPQRRYKALGKASTPNFLTASHPPHSLGALEELRIAALGKSGITALLKTLGQMDAERAPRRRPRSTRFARR